VGIASFKTIYVVHLQWVGPKEGKRLTLTTEGRKRILTGQGLLPSTRGKKKKRGSFFLLSVCGKKGGWNVNLVPPAEGKKEASFFSYFSNFYSNEKRGGGKREGMNFQLFNLFLPGVKRGKKALPTSIPKTR